MQHVRGRDLAAWTRSFPPDVTREQFYRAIRIALWLTNWHLAVRAEAKVGHCPTFRVSRPVFYVI